MLHRYNVPTCIPWYNCSLVGIVCTCAKVPVYRYTCTEEEFLGIPGLPGYSGSLGRVPEGPETHVLAFSIANDDGFVCIN